ncbi:MAG: cation transporter [Acidobacteria bacterium]|nr:cation transporter [Acidobacteriota bacterium]
MLAPAFRHTAAVTAIEESYRTARRVALLGVAVSAVLACTNIVVGLLVRSTSVVATGFEFAGDVLASSIVLIGMGVAARPADRNHPYGHGRFETLSAFVVGLILAAAGATICYRSLQAVGATHPPPGALAAAALVGAIVLRGIMSSVKFRVGRRLRSSALIADAWNDAVDILSALAALVAVALATYDPVHFLAADHYGGFVVGIVVVITGLRVLRDASLELADTMPDPELTEEIARISKSVAGVQGVDKVFARKTGLQYHIDLHIEVDPDETIAASHAIGGHVRATLKRELPWVADVLVHLEPSDRPKTTSAP